MTSTSATREGEIILADLDRRAAAIARALGARKAGGRYFLGTRQAAQMQALYAAGFHVVRRGGLKLFQRDPRALDLYAALRVSRSTGQQPLDSVLEIKHTD